MTSGEVVLKCGLNVRVGCQDRIFLNSAADETLAYWESRYLVCKGSQLPQSCKKIICSIVEMLF